MKSAKKRLKKFSDRIQKVDIQIWIQSESDSRNTDQGDLGYMNFWIEFLLINSDFFELDLDFIRSIDRHICIHEPQHDMKYFGYVWVMTR